MKSPRNVGEILLPYYIFTFNFYRTKLWRGSAKLPKLSVSWLDDNKALWEEGLEHNKYQATSIF